MPENKKKRSRFLSKDELQLLDEGIHNYVESWEEAMDSFLKDGELRGLREKTLFFYEKETRMIFRYLREQELGLVKPYELTKNQVENNIILYMKNIKKLSVSTINIRMRAFRTVMNWLHTNKKIPKNPVTNIKRLKDRRKEIVAFNPEQLKRFFKAIEKDTWIGVRDYAICLVLLECGLRQNELLNLSVVDIVWEQNYILVRHSKTYQMRKVPITNDTKKALKRWIMVRGEVRTDNLFCSISGLELSPRGLHQVIVKYGKKSKIDNVRCSPHTFRHTMAKLYLQNSGDLFSLQQVLGHVSLDQTRQYIQFMHEDIAELHKKHSPLKHLNL